MFPNANVVMMARIEGALTEAELIPAVRKARCRHPLLGARVRLDNEGTGWFTLDGVPAIPISVSPRLDEESWMRVAVAQHREPFDFLTGPLVRIALLESTRGSDLIVTAHHAICDGLSLTFLIRDILEFLADPGRPIEPLLVPSMPDASILPPSAAGSSLSRVGFKVLNWIWKRKGITFGAADCYALHRAFWQDHAGHMLAWRLERSQTSTLVSRCREEGVTVTTALIAAFVAAQNQVQRQRDYLNEVVVSVDYRDRLRQPVGDAFAFYASAVRPEVSYDPELPFWQTARDIHRQIRQLLTDETIFESQQLNDLSPTLLDALTFAKNGRLDDGLVNRLVERMGFNRVTASLVMTNLGRVDVPVEYGPRRLSAVYGPYVYSDTIEKYLGVVTLDGRMHLTLCHCDGIIDVATVKSVRDAAMAHLRRAVGW
jgi:NRPS condensation-like uncharacterized protein